MVRETWLQSQVASYQRLLKWYLIPPCLTLSIIGYVSRVKWSNLGKRVAPGVVAIEKGDFWSPSTMVANYYYIQFKNVNRLDSLVPQTTYQLLYAKIWLISNSFITKRTKFSKLILCTYSWYQVFLCNTNNLPTVHFYQIQLIYTQLYGFKRLYLSNKKHLFAHCHNIMVWFLCLMAYQPL